MESNYNKQILRVVDISHQNLLIGDEYNLKVIQVCSLTSNAEEAEVERFYEDLQDLLELTPKKDALSL